jgi:hypothetical protein
MMLEEIIGALFEADPRILLEELMKPTKTLRKHYLSSNGNLIRDLFNKRQEKFRLS